MSELKVTDRRWWARGDDALEGSEEPRLKPTYIEELEKRLAAKDAELQDIVAKYRSSADEFEQARTRLRKEVSKDVERGRRSLLVSFLEVLDNLDRALAAASDRPEDPLVQGISMVQQQFVSVLDSLGIRRLNPIGEPFDPALHEAVATAPASGNAPKGSVVGVVRSGYLIGEEVLRPAMVAVVADA
jgi:molecular chaperone GrpE